jgi:hypothetical protein
VHGAVEALGTPEVPEHDSELRSDTENATVWIYRHRKFYGSGLEPTVFCDEHKVAKMDNGRYFMLMLEPGVHRIRSTDKKGGLDMPFHAGEEYFVELFLVTKYYKIGEGRLALRSRDNGMQALMELKPLEPRDVLDKQRVSSTNYEIRE